MQSCVKCGWDTRSGSRICAACRTAEVEARSGSAPDPNAEKEALLTAVLRSAHSDPGPTDDATTGEISGEIALRAAQAVDDPEDEHVADSEDDQPDEAEAYEQVTLREIAPGEDEEMPATGSEPVTAGDTGDIPAPEITSTESEHDQSDVSTSLVDAFDDAHTLRKPDAVQDPPKVTEPGTNGTSTIGEDTAEDLAALFDGQTPWDRTPPDDPPPAHAEPDPDMAAPSPPQSQDTTTAPPSRETDTTRSPSYEHDTAEDLAALFNASAPWDTSPPGDAPPAEPETDFDPLPDLYEPVAYPHSTGDIAAPITDAGTDIDEHVDSWSTGDLDTSSGLDTGSDLDAGRFEPESKNTPYSPAEWPWVGRSGDGGFWAPPKDRRETINRNHAGTTADPHDDGIYENGSRRPAVDAPRTSSAPPPPDTQAPQQSTATDDSAPDDERSLVERLKTGFVELGAWTAVAQVALLAVGMLCIIQVFVLIVVSSYLSEARGQGGDVVAGSLAAHAKVDGVMLPALLVFTVVTFAFAVSRSFVGRGNASTPPGILGRPLGIPMALWRVLLAAITLLLVIIPSAPSTIDAAQRITQWAMVACAVLGAACFAAPRGLDPSPPAAKNDGGSTKAGTPAKAPATASSRPAA